MVENLRTKKEKVLFRICFCVSLLAWIALVVSLVGLFYGAIIGFFILTAHAMMIAHLKGHALKLSSEQLPEIYNRVVEAAEKLEMEKVPEVYVMQAGGMLNAFATKLFGRNFVVIYSDLLEACDPQGREMDMIIGHELGHLALGHLKWLMFLAPARILPWIGAAYSRACEYSCDRCGAQIVGELSVASRGLVVLASGGKYARQVNLDAFVRQAQETRGFWASVYELNASHPYLAKRVAALVNWRKPGTIPVAGRSILAYPLAPLFSMTAPGGAAAAPLLIVAMTGIIAAIAIPQFETYRAKAKEAALQAEIDKDLQSFNTVISEYAEANGTWPCSVEDIDFPEGVQAVQEKNWELVVNCERKFVALVYPEGQKRLYRLVYFETGEFESGKIN